MKSRLLFFIALGLCSDSCAEILEVHNTVKRDVFMSVYQGSSEIVKSLQQVAPIRIKSGQTLEIERPSQEAVCAFSFSPSDLGSTIGFETFQKLSRVENKFIVGSDLYIGLEGQSLKSYDAVEWGVILPAVNRLRATKDLIMNLVTAPLEQYLQPIIIEYVKKSSQAVLENPYKNTVGHVRVGNTLCAQEKAYVAKRTPRVKKVLEKIMHHPIQKVPTIALLGSGGGYRALVALLGFLIGLDACGLVDAATYVAGVSGSAGLISVWMSNTYSLQELRKFLIPKLAQGLYTIDPQGVLLLVQQLMVKAAFDQPLTLVDLLSGPLGSAMFENFGDNRHRVYLSQQSALLEQAQRPLPIYTAVRADEFAEQDWFEFTPYEVGCARLGNRQGMYIKPQFFGRKFHNGASIDFAPEQSLIYFIGIFTSAYAVQIDDLLPAFVNPQEVKPPFDQLFDAVITSIGNRRVSTAEIHNFTFGLAKSELKDNTMLHLADAGGFINIPFIPVSGERSERKADIMIIMDASMNLPFYLSEIEQYAREHGLLFPKIDYTDISTRALSIFKDDTNPEVPLVIYIPVVHDTVLLEQAKKTGAFKEIVSQLEGFDVGTCTREGYCKTSNFYYTEQEVMQLSGLMEFNVLSNQQKIIDAIDWKIKQLEKND